MNITRSKAAGPRQYSSWDRKTFVFHRFSLTRRLLQGLDGLAARKKSLLETVKETETFKVAKEILEKYDQESPKSLSQPPSPSSEKRQPPNHRGPPIRPDQSPATPAHTSDIPPRDSINRPPVKMLYTKSFESIPAAEVLSPF
ncbi:hypothetical protein OESDEN_00225 [Oesophagostomum dentatum]|uniref:Uncharacterized protein n=1 Tax=Oesophagostomum dentatum TaxID=61180 RepID=A0A0B1TWE1_OESDE|nr:hypothetical protein OESDEN_00225 [Oesophagostomum dentatum]